MKWNGSNHSGMALGEDDIEDMVPLDADDNDNDDDGHDGQRDDLLVETLISPASIVSPTQQSNMIQLPTTSTNDALMKVDVNQWRLEVERVTPMLKVTLGNDNKDWRVHWQQLQHYSAVRERYMYISGSITITYTETMIGS